MADGPTLEKRTEYKEGDIIQFNQQELDGTPGLWAFIQAPGATNNYTAIEKAIDGGLYRMVGMPGLIFPIHDIAGRLPL